MHCRQSLSAEPSQYGQQLECPACFNLIDVPVPRRAVRSKSPQRAKKAEFSKALPVLLIVFPALTCISLMLPWAELGFISASGFRKAGTENSLMLMLFMAVPLIGGIFSLVNGKYTSRSYGVLSVLACIAAVAMMLFFYSELTQNLNNVNTRTKSSFLRDLKISIGIGFPLSCVFVAASFISAFSELCKKRGV